eukprot:PhF_6_TR26167/c1_g1_i2/m.37155
MVILPHSNRLVVSQTNGSLFAYTLVPGVKDTNTFAFNRAYTGGLKNFTIFRPHPGKRTVSPTLITCDLPKLDLIEEVIEDPTDNSRRLAAHRGHQVQSKIRKLKRTYESVVMENFTKGFTALAVPSRESIARVDPIFVGADDGTIGLFGLGNVYEDYITPIYHTWRPHTAPVTQLTIAENSNCFISGSFDCTVQMWDYEKNERVLCIQVGEPLDKSDDIKPTHFLMSKSYKSRYHAVTSFDYNVTLSLLITGGGGQRAFLWNPLAPTPVARLDAQRNPVVGVKFRTGSNQVVVASEDQTVYIYDIRTFRVLQSVTEIVTDPPRNPLQKISALGFDNNRDSIITAWNHPIILHSNEGNWVSASTSTLGHEIAGSSAADEKGKSTNSIQDILVKRVVGLLTSGNYVYVADGTSVYTFEVIGGNLMLLTDDTFRCSPGQELTSLHWDINCARWLLGCYGGEAIVVAVASHDVLDSLPFLEQRAVCSCCQIVRSEGVEKSTLFVIAGNYHAIAMYRDIEGTSFFGWYSVLPSNKESVTDMQRTDMGLVISSSQGTVVLFDCDMLCVSMSFNVNAHIPSEIQTTSMELQLMTTAWNAPTTAEKIMTSMAHCVDGVCCFQDVVVSLLGWGLCDVSRVSKSNLSRQSSSTQSSASVFPVTFAKGSLALCACCGPTTSMTTEIAISDSDGYVSVFEFDTNRCTEQCLPNLVSCFRVCEEKESVSHMVYSNQDNTYIVSTSCGHVKILSTILAMGQDELETHEFRKHATAMALLEEKKSTTWRGSWDQETATSTSAAFASRSMRRSSLYSLPSPSQLTTGSFPIPQVSESEGVKPRHINHYNRPDESRILSMLRNKILRTPTAPEPKKSDTVPPLCVPKLNIKRIYIPQRDPVLEMPSTARVPRTAVAPTTERNATPRQSLTQRTNMPKPPTPTTTTTTRSPHHGRKVEGVNVDVAKQVSRGHELFCQVLNARRQRTQNSRSKTLQQLRIQDLAETKF